MKGLISDLLERGLVERGLIRRGSFSTKSSDKDMFGSFSVLLSYTVRNQHTILRLKYINSTQFLSETILNHTSLGHFGKWANSLRVILRAAIDKMVSTKQRTQGNKG